VPRHEGALRTRPEEHELRRAPLPHGDERISQLSGVSVIVERTDCEDCRQAREADQAAGVHWIQRRGRPPAARMRRRFWFDSTREVYP
jgi:hypothetical protein